MASQTRERQIREGEGDEISLQVKMSAYTLSWRGICGAEFCITPGINIVFFPIWVDRAKKAKRYYASKYHIWEKHSPHRIMNVCENIFIDLPLLLNSNFGDNSP